jgi:adenine/guanine phosphoribosyltransferase-like PRPP-binding protein
MQKNFNEVDFEGIDLADEMIAAIEKDYGRSIQRIPRFKKTGSHRFDIICIFSDYRMLQAEVKIVDIYGVASITVEGIYY